MRQSGWRLGVIVVVVLVAVLLVYSASVQSTVSIVSTNLRVYRDGLVHVEQKLLIDEFSPQGSLTLLSDTVENLIILDQDELAVDYEFTEREFGDLLLGRYSG